MVLNTFTAAQIKIVLAWFLQFGEPIFDVFGTINLIIACMVLFFAFLFYVRSFFLVSWNWKMTKDEAHCSKQSLIEAPSKQRKFSILWESFSIERFVGRYFYAIQTIRNILFVTIIYGLQNEAILQACLLLIASITYILIFLRGKPFKYKRDFIATILNETILIIEELLILVFAINQKIKLMELNTTIQLGWVMIGCIIAALGINGLFLIIGVICTVLESRKKKKEKEKLKEKEKEKEKILKNEEIHSPDMTRPIESSNVSKIDIREEQPSQLIEIELSKQF